VFGNIDLLFIEMALIELTNKIEDIEDSFLPLDQ
jgi:hypothetical protein